MGYTKLQLQANKMDIFASCFETATGSIQDMVAGGGVSPEGGDWIRMYDPQTYSYIDAYWFGDGNGVYENADADEPCADEGWGDVNQNIVLHSLDAGQGFWASSVEPAFIQVSGTVVQSGDLEIPANKMVLIGNPFFVDTDIQTIIAKGNFNIEGGDWIRMYDPQTYRYTDAYWFGEGNGVYENADAEEPCADQGWGDVNQNIVNKTVPAGHGFWCSSVEGGILSFPNPLETK